MSYATSRLPLTPSPEVRSGPYVIRYEPSAAARVAANEPAERRIEVAHPIDPMLLVYQERVETFRLIAAALGRGYHAVAGWLRA